MAQPALPGPISFLVDIDGGSIALGDSRVLWTQDQSEEVPEMAALASMCEVITFGHLALAGDRCECSHDQPANHDPDAVVLGKAHG